MASEADDRLGVPTGPDELTAAWLDRALPPGEGREPITAVEVTPLGNHVGFLGDLYRMQIDYGSAAEPSGPTSVVVKLPTTDPGGRQVGAMLGVGPREVAFYREVVPRSLGLRVPRCHHAAVGDDPDRWVLVLEDLGDAAQTPYVGGPDGHHLRAELAIDALADLHARWWQADHRFDWMPGFDGRGVGGLRDAWLGAIPIFLDRYGHLIPEVTAGWLRRFAPTLPDWSDRAAGEPLTIVHADYRLDNLVFGPGGDTVTMIDWQTALRGPAAMDLTSFVATALTIDDRRRWEAELIERYLDQLAAAGVDVDPTWFARSYDENLLWWMGQFANNLARLEPDDPVAQRTLDSTIERVYHAALDRDVGRLLP